MPSILIEGATVSSVSWNSPMVWAPHTPIQVRMAPVRFSVPSVLDVKVLMVYRDRERDVQGQLATLVAAGVEGE